MNADEIRAIQAPLKARYREQPETAVITHRARGRIDLARLTCETEIENAGAPAGLHPAAGGDGSLACSGDMLLASLVACAGVTLCAISTALALPVTGGLVSAEGEVDFRGTLGVAKDAPVGFREIRLHFALEGALTPEQPTKLIDLTEKYCVILQTLKRPAKLSVSGV